MFCEKANNWYWLIIYIVYRNNIIIACLTQAFSQNLYTETQFSALSSRGRSPTPLNINITSSTPLVGKQPPDELFSTPVKLPDKSWADKPDSLSSPSNSRDEADFDYPVQPNQSKNDRKLSNISSSHETVV